MNFRLQRVRFELEASRPLAFPVPASNKLRGAIGAVMRERGDGSYEEFFAPVSMHGPSGLSDPPRPFVLRPRTDWVAAAANRVAAGEHPDDVVLMPGEGDLLVMGGACQREWLHGVAAFTTDQPRVSLTWRWSSRRGRPDTNPGHYDGRQFSGDVTRAGSRTRRSTS